MESLNLFSRRLLRVRPSRLPAFALDSLSFFPSLGYPLESFFLGLLFSGGCRRSLGPTPPSVFFKRNATQSSTFSWTRSALSSHTGLVMVPKSVGDHIGNHAPLVGNLPVLLHTFCHNFCGGGAHTLVYYWACLLYTSPSPRDLSTSRMPSSA